MKAKQIAFRIIQAVTVAFVAASVGYIVYQIIINPSQFNGYNF